MTNIVKTIKMRDQHSFSNVEIIEVSQRVLLRKMEGDAEFGFYYPETVSYDELLGELSKLGELRHNERLVCSDTAREITRGAVLKEDGREYYFSIYATGTGEYEKDTVQHMVRALQLSGRRPPLPKR